MEINKGLDWNTRGKHVGLEFHVKKTNKHVVLEFYAKNQQQKNM